MSLIPFAPFILSGAFLLPSCFLLFLRSALKLFEKSKRLSLVRITTLGKRHQGTNMV
jgi:hypothetical protein